MKNISKGTIIRTTMLVLVVLNYILKTTGHDVINVSENEIGEFIEMVISVATIIVCYWKNNSLSKYAIEADKLLQQLKDGDKNEY